MKVEAQQGSQDGSRKDSRVIVFIDLDSGQEVGSLDCDDKGYWHFEGDVDECAAMFVEAVLQLLPNALTYTPEHGLN